MHTSIKPFQLILICLGIFCKLNAQSPNDHDILYWSQNHRLDFGDFKGKPTQSDTTLHEVSPKILTHKLGAIIKSIDVHLVTEGHKTRFTIQAGMKQSLSWIKDHGDSSELKHEQGHFDICEIYARILRRDIQKAKSLQEAKEMYEKTSDDEEAEQDNYDKDNTYQAGGITYEWQEKISNRLKELEAYKNPVVTMLFPG
jgi:hypothetical protein